MPERARLWRRAALCVSAIALALAGCSVFSRATLYMHDSAYSFRGKTVGLCVFLSGDEQEALSEIRVIRRTISTVEEGGYASGDEVAPLQTDAGTVLPPASVTSLKSTLKHSRYYDEELIHPMIAETKRILEERGYRVVVVPVPDGEVRLTELAGRAQGMGCEILAAETVALVRSWNIQMPYRPKGSQERVASFSWQSHVGGIVITNISFLDIATNKVVWQHSRREIDPTFLAPLLGELYDDQLAATQFAVHPAQYQVWMYRQSSTRALALMFGTTEKGFVPLPCGSNAPDSLRRAAAYEAGQKVFVRPERSSLVWLPAGVVADRGASVEVRWAEGVWPAYAERTSFERTDVMAKPEAWPPLVWVRARAKLDYAPYRFLRVDARGLVYVELAGDREPQTFLLGRVGIIP